MDFQENLSMEEFQRKPMKMFLVECLEKFLEFPLYSVRNYWICKEFLKKYLWKTIYLKGGMIF